MQFLFEAGDMAPWKHPADWSSFCSQGLCLRIFYCQLLDIFVSLGPEGIGAGGRSDHIFFSPFHFQRLWIKNETKPVLGHPGWGRIGEARWWCSLWGSRSLWVKVRETRHTDFSLAAGTLERARSCNPSPNLFRRHKASRLKISFLSFPRCVRKFEGKSLDLLLKEAIFPFQCSFTLERGIVVTLKPRSLRQMPVVFPTTAPVPQLPRCFALYTFFFFKSWKTWIDIHLTHPARSSDVGSSFSCHLLSFTNT